MRHTLNSGRVSPFRWLRLARIERGFRPDFSPRIGIKKPLDPDDSANPSAHCSIDWRKRPAGADKTNEETLNG